MVQSDFATFDFQRKLDDEIRSCNTAGENSKFSMSEHGDSAQNQKQEHELSIDVAPVSFITEEMYSSNAAWESSEMAIPSYDCMNMDLASDMFEPHRCLKEFTAPKRFYRTFWRSVSRRMLALSRT
jgi:hypothetical protein